MNSFERMTKEYKIALIERNHNNRIRRYSVIALTAHRAYHKILYGIAP